MYPALENALNRNEFLKNRLLDAEEIKQLSFLKNQCVFRFESFGDIDTITQLRNYNNIASEYKNCVDVGFPDVLLPTSTFAINSKNFKEVFSKRCSYE